MAKADIKMPEDFLMKISQLGSNFDAVAERVLEAGGEVVLAKVQSNLAGVVGSGTKYDSRSTGELERSLGLSPAKLNRDGNHDIKVGFSEPRSDGESNAKLANILEYGKHGQPDMAITDMSDNANKMGTDMSSIQNAYKGFAKQNYTMLDNLKLGYGGTKEEMERLLADAQAISGIEYDISSYADVVDAIHVIQQGQWLLLQPYE